MTATAKIAIGFVGWTRTDGQANDNVACLPNPKKKAKGFEDWTRTGNQAN